MPGSCVTVTLEGSRPLLAEVQALVATTGGGGSPRRAVSGLDAQRVAMVHAVVERRGRVKLADADVFAASVGGVRITEPAADLALALAIASAAQGHPAPAGVVALGEVGLSGEIRRVGGTGRRLAEAARLGYKVALVPPDAGRRPGGHAGDRGARPGRRLRPLVLSVRIGPRIGHGAARHGVPGGPTQGPGRVGT